MSNGIHHGIGDGTGNSLSPEPCALIPRSSSARIASLLGATEAVAAALLGHRMRAAAQRSES